ncbi:MAG: acylglycerol kinase family protein, partial [Prevotellaceae bacterium]|jgi:diacylglycerol kinase family enzyme|nr:acylglycerol kinase family protein [Prevotellaceae bacterium]
MRSVAFIVNPRSGTRRRQAAWARTGEVGGLLPGCETSLYATRCAGDAYRQAKRCVDAGCDVVVAVGGDGTVNEVARALMHTPAALAIIPAGSGNGLARHLKIPMNARKALDLINRFRVQPVDAARINDRFFFCTAGVGFDALVGARFNASETRGLANYVRFAASAFRR